MIVIRSWENAAVVAAGAHSLFKQILLPLLSCHLNCHQNLVVLFFSGWLLRKNRLMRWSVHFTQDVTFETANFPILDSMMRICFERPNTTTSSYSQRTFFVDGFSSRQTESLRWSRQTFFSGEIEATLFSFSAVTANSEEDEGIKRRDAMTTNGSSSLWGQNVNERRLRSDHDDDFWGYSKGTQREKLRNTRCSNNRQLLDQQPFSGRIGLALRLIKRPLYKGVSSPSTSPSLL